MRRLSLVAVLAVVALGLLAPAASAGSLTRADRKAINATLDTFVTHAVLRKNVGASYDVVTPEMRGGMTRAEWARGDVPAYPYPAKGKTFHGWHLDYVEPNAVGVSLLIHPRRGAKVGPFVFDIILKRMHGSWLVDSFAPTAMFAPVGGPAKVRAIPDYSPGARGDGPLGGQSRLSDIYTVIPFAAIGGLLVLLLGWGLATRYRNRRHAAPPRALPPLPVRGSSIPADDARTRPAYRP